MIEEIIKKHVYLFVTRLSKEGFYYGARGCRRFDPTPWDINNGYCDEFAQAIEAEVPGAVGYWLEQLSRKYEDCSHVVILYKDRYYDAECPAGVDFVEDLPYFQNKGKSRLDVLSETDYKWAGV